MTKTIYKLSLAAVLLFNGVSAFSQEGTNPPTTESLQNDIHKINDNLSILNRIKISGWLQAQYQHADTVSSSTFLLNNTNAFLFAGNTPGGASYSDRFFIRRGRVKFTFENELTQYVLQIDANERNITIRDFYAKFTDKWCKTFSLTMGLQNRPFGYEIQQSSSVRETPERSRFTQTLTPNERDLGAMLTIQMPASSKWHFLKLDAGLFNGTGIYNEYDSKKDLIARLSGTHTKKNEKMTVGYGISYYGGYVQQLTNKVYSNIITDTAGVKRFTLSNDTANYRSYAQRQYINADAQVTIDFPFGIMNLRGEYVMGTQPGQSTTTFSPGFSAGSIVLGGDIYVRQFNAAYFYFVQNIGKTPLQAVFKYDYYDPNTKVAGDEIGKGKGTNIADIKYTTMGFGLNYRWNTHVKLVAYYDMVKNETSANLAGFTTDLKDNIMTLRVQYRF